MNKKWKCLMSRARPPSVDITNDLTPERCFCPLPPSSPPHRPDIHIFLEHFLGRYGFIFGEFNSLKLFISHLRAIAGFPCPLIQRCHPRSSILTLKRTFLTRVDSLRSRFWTSTDKKSRPLAPIVLDSILKSPLIYSDLCIFALTMS